MQKLTDILASKPNLDAVPVRLSGFGVADQDVENDCLGFDALVDKLRRFCEPAIESVEILVEIGEGSGTKPLRIENDSVTRFPKPYFLESVAPVERITYIFSDELGFRKPSLGLCEGSETFNSPRETVVVRGPPSP